MWPDYQPALDKWNKRNQRAITAYYLKIRHQKGLCANCDHPRDIAAYGRLCYRCKNDLPVKE